MNTLDYGGCKWQHMQYSAQLEFKEKEVLNNLKRIGNVAIKSVLPIYGNDEPYFYRNKMEFSFSSNRWMTQEEIDSMRHSIKMLWFPQAWYVG